MKVVYKKSIIDNQLNDKELEKTLAGVPFEVEDCE